MMRDVETRLLGSNDMDLMRSMLSMFSEAFEDSETFSECPPDDAYLSNLLARPEFIAIAAIIEGNVVAGLTAYVLQKYEQMRSEVYLYDLAVAEPYRRHGIATALMRRLQHEGHQRGAGVVFVQADVDDAPAIALYTKHGIRKDVLHFDITVD